MIKLIHTSDWHLGKIIYGRSLLEDQKAFLYNFFIPLIRREKPDAVIISGDIYDRKIAPSSAIRLFDDILTYISLELKTKIILISGNHDGSDRLSVGNQLLSRLGVHIINRLDNDIAPVVIANDSDTADIWAIPYIEPCDVRSLINDDSIHSFAQSYQAIFDLIKPKINNNHTNILSAHCFVTGAAISQSESPVYIGGSGDVPAELFDAFDYCALGHLHAPQNIKDNICYCGSPIKYSFDEQHHKKGVNIVSIENGSITAEHRLYEPIRNMRVITGKFDDLIDNAASNKSDDYIFISLTDDVPIYEPVARLREYYPNILGLESQWMYSNENDLERAQLRRELISNSTDDTEIFSQFLQQICKIEPDEESIKLFREICKPNE